VLKNNPNKKGDERGREGTETLAGKARESLRRKVPQKKKRTGATTG